MSGLSQFLIFIHICLLVLIAIGANISAGDAGFVRAIIGIAITLLILSIPPIIAHARNTKNRNSVFLLSYCWLIPFSWIIAICMALFGKKDNDTDLHDLQSQDDNQPDDDDNNNEIEEFDEEKQHVNIVVNIPANAIDRAFYRVGRGITNTATTVRDSRIVRGTISTVFKIALIIGIFMLFVFIRMASETRNPRNTYNRQSTAYTGATNLKSSQYTSGWSNKSLQNKPAVKPKSAEQIWFENAAASMK